MGRFAVFLLVAMACAEAPVEHIVLVTLDTHRADVIGAYGSSAGHTPSFDRIAAHSAVFEHAVTPIGTTVPAHLSMFTGLVHGATESASTAHPYPSHLGEFRELGYVE